MSVVVIYHKGCMDGKAAAAVVEKKHPGAKFYALNYADLPPMKSTELSMINLYIVDFSFPEEIMRQLKQGCREVIWIDHHKTSIPLREDLGWGNVDMSECGATLTWMVLFPELGEKEMPQILKYVRDRDIWQWKLTYSKEVSEALAARFTGDDFKGLLKIDPRDLIAEGKVFWDRTMRQVERNCERAYPVMFHSHKAMAVNVLHHVSETGDQLLKHTDAEIAIMYWREKDMWIHSLRSLDPVDVSAIAKEYGGGGHAQAAGFKLPTLCSDIGPRLDA